MDLSEWMKSGKYLPDPLRDFGDAGWVFRYINQYVQNRRKKDAEEGCTSRLEVIDSVSAHIYVIDFFLWYMAIHGYTLQKTRRKFDYPDLDEYVSEFRDKSRDAMHAAAGLTKSK